ncbi:unnamed protein product, partial [Polarella glacialis]
DALCDFLQSKEGCVAHINEVNNDRFLRQVMAAQLPKPVSAVNKAWLKVHESLFTLLRTQDNEMYVALTKAVEEQKAARKLKAAKEDLHKQPAYRQVIQDAGGDEPLVYEYPVKARGDSIETFKASPSSAAPQWQETFKGALEQVMQRCLSAQELLAAVPLFAPAMGAKRPREQQECLVMFLEAWPNIFRVEKRGTGAERTYTISAR